MKFKKGKLYRAIRPIGLLAIDYWLNSCEEKKVDAGTVLMFLEIRKDPSRRLICPQRVFLFEENLFVGAYDHIDIAPSKYFEKVEL
jgi:hypothetical protein